MLTPELCKEFLAFVDEEVAAVTQGSCKALGEFIRAVAKNPESIRWSTWVSRLTPSAHTTMMRNLCVKALRRKLTVKVRKQAEALAELLDVEKV